jgi:hypothetical protein
VLNLALLVPSMLSCTQSCSGTYTVEIVDTASGDAQYYVPRCIGGCGGNINLDKVNMKVSSPLAWQCCHYWFQILMTQ